MSGPHSDNSVSQPHTCDCICTYEDRQQGWLGGYYYIEHMAGSEGTQLMDVLYYAALSGHLVVMVLSSYLCKIGHCVSIVVHRVNLSQHHMAVDRSENVASQPKYTLLHLPVAPEIQIRL